MAPSAAPDMAFLRDLHAVPTAAMGWWAWWDQGLYQRAAVAWANGVTASKFHWYLPGYPLLAAPFVRVNAADPFLVPDLASLVITLLLFCSLASRLLDDVPLRVPVACLLFVASSVLSPRSLWAWVVPFTTTPETPCIFGALLAAIRLVEKGKSRDAFFAGLMVVAIAGFRPADAVLVGLAMCSSVAPALLSHSRRLPENLVAALCGALIPLVIFGAAYLATWGTRLSDYVVLSERIGFEPRLLPLRWVTLMVDPRPLYPDGRGLAEVFFWIVPGIAGMAGSLVSARGTVAILHRLVIGTLIGDVVTFMIYRDLHPTGLWKYGNYHYFKWTLPLFALYAFRLLPMIVIKNQRRPMAIAAACLTIPMLFCWQASRSGFAPLRADKDKRTITIGPGLNPINAIILMPGHGLATQPVVDGSAVTASGIVLSPGLDFVIYSAQDLLRIVPLRPLPSEPTTFHFPMTTHLDEGATPVLARQTITWNIPFSFFDSNPEAEIAIRNHFKKP